MQHNPTWELVDGSIPSAKNIIRLVDQEAVDGIIGEIRSEALTELCRSKVDALVLVASGQRDLPRPCWGRITTDNVAVGKLGFDFLWNRGFRKLAFIGSAGRVFSDTRLSGFSSAAVAHGLSVLTFNDFAPERDQPLTRWLAALPPRTAILTANDEVGVAVLRVIRSIGRPVPEDLVVLGVDNDELTCLLIHPALSSIDIDTRQIGFKAAELMNAILDNQAPLSIDVRSFEVSPKRVVERRSTDSLAIEDPRIRRVIQIIQSRACDGLTVDELIAESFMSRRSLENSFKTSMGRTLQEHINLIRLEKARDMLRHTHYATPDIAAACGWPSASQMNKMFRRYFNLTPTEFRHNRKRPEPSSATTS
ncbi:MAG: substrate-binding domain-containing protein [Verrucomicrobia bacterium]|nr:substrate-binding domain-containing protein [Verrucomicrobiota bacterium]